MGFGPLVDARWLHEHFDDPDVRVVDFRWYLQGRDGRAEYMKGHIPGAVFVDLEDVTGSEGGGRHPLPTQVQFESAMRFAGIGRGTKVVVYDDAGGSIAARLWFLLGWFGHSDQAVLDGGLQAWGEPIEDVIATVPQGDFVAAEPDRSRILDHDDLLTLRGMPLIDARAGERYRGETEPVDPKAGHIPGAVSAPYVTNLDSSGRFRAPEELRERYMELGAQHGAVFYCGSGVNACHHLLAMEVAGIEGGRLYAGSWSDWSTRDLPVATGPEP